jgi:uncharacterized SAM-binding protein YcdF (DUF218 family)
MFFLLSKVLSFLFTPITWIISLILFGLITKKTNRKKFFLITAIAVTYLFSNRFLLCEVLRKWEIQPISYEKVVKADYAVVLGGFSEFDNSTDRLQLSPAGDRIWQALQLYKQKKVKKILITGGSGSLLRQEEFEADHVKSFLITLKIPADDIITESISRNTHENAKFTSEWLKKHDPDATCILITSAWHMRRAKGCFTREKVKIIPYSTDIQSRPRMYDIDILLNPTVGTMYTWEAFIKELIGFSTYWMIGYL